MGQPLKNIFIWGATYKKNTSSVFRSYTSRLIAKYKNKYRYTFYDPGAGVKADLFKIKKTNFLGISKILELLLEYLTKISVNSEIEKTSKNLDNEYINGMI